MAACVGDGGEFAGLGGGQLDGHFCVDRCEIEWKADLLVFWGEVFGFVLSEEKAELCALGFGLYEFCDCDGLRWEETEECPVCRLRANRGEEIVVFERL